MVVSFDVVIATISAIMSFLAIAGMFAWFSHEHNEGRGSVAGLIAVLFVLMTWFAWTYILNELFSFYANGGG